MEKKFRYLVAWRLYGRSCRTCFLDGKAFTFILLMTVRAEWRRMTMVIILTCVTIMSFSTEVCDEPEQ